MPEAGDPARHLPELLPGAKIGVLGLNGSGKSTLLRIMAGVDKSSRARRGAAGQSRSLPAAGTAGSTQARTCAERRGAVAHVKDALKRLDEVYAAYAEPDATSDKIAPSRRSSRRSNTGHRRPQLDRQLEVRRDALRLPPWGGGRHQDLGGERRRVRCASCCCRSPTCCCSTSPPTTSTPSRCAGSSTTSRPIPARSSP